jgi:hypothetical protein
MLLLSFALMQMKVSKEKIKAAHLFLKRIRLAGNKRTRRLLCAFIKCVFVLLSWKVYFGLEQHLFLLAAQKFFS